MKIRSVLGYTAAALTIVAAALIPFLFHPWLDGRVAATGVQVDQFYSGGPVVRTISKGDYTIEVHPIVHPRALQRGTAYVQVSWTPVSALPARISDEVDVDNDGKPDFHVTFFVPKDPKAPLAVDVEPLQPGFSAMHGVGRDTYSRLIARVKEQIVVRVPVTK
jgi:hypothetical protein